jgi:hypothetical protein
VYSEAVEDCWLGLRVHPTALPRAPSTLLGIHRIGL